MTSYSTPVAGYSKAKIFAPNDSRITFCNSPFPSHKETSALDIYPTGAKFGDIAPCPVAGTVKDVKQFSSPNPFPNKPPNYEYLTLIQPDEQPDVYVKIIHAKPVVNVGDHVAVGDDLACFVHSGYYPFWVDPHLHVEVRDPNDAVRARGSYYLDVINSSDQKAPTNTSNGFSGTITKVDKRYVLVRPDPESFITFGNFSGLPATVEGKIGICDAVIPFMGYGGIITTQKATLGAPVYLFGKQIGTVTENLVGLVKFKTESVNWNINGFEYKGLSGKIFLDKQWQIKLVPYKTGQVDGKVDDRIEIKG